MARILKSYVIVEHVKRNHIKVTKPKHPETGDVGTISIRERGGNVDTKRFGIVFISKDNLNTALPNDTVEVGGIRRGEDGTTTGVIRKIMKRDSERFVGTIETQNEKRVLIADNRGVYVPFLLFGKDLKDGYKALIRMKPWDDKTKLPEGDVMEIIGPAGAHETEMKAITLARGFVSSYPPTVLAEAQRIALKYPSESEAEFKKRRDFRDVPTVTIDPADAKDFDDAISLKPLSDGLFELGVHIADVSHFVLPNSELDREAREREFSVYLPDRTIPMLPEILSNELCSLNPNVPRLTFSAVFDIDIHGEVKKRWFGKTVISSHKRFSYEEANDALTTGSGEWGPFLKTVNTIAVALRKAKERAGAIDFETDEIRFELDPEGRPIRIYKKERLPTHKLVEECMLLANREVASYMEQSRIRRKSDEPMIYRVHNTPSGDKLANLQILLSALGYRFPKTPEEVTGNVIQKLFEQIEGKPEEHLIKTATLRSMAKATYETSNVGHFGLAFDDYTHFTSPIRRYPDLLVHRLLALELEGKKVPPAIWPTFAEAARLATEQEIAAAEAEREAKKLKQVEYMTGQVGKLFTGTISGVTDFGLFVEEDSTLSEGMVRFNALPKDFYRFEKSAFAIVGDRTKTTYRLGDRVRIKVLSADPKKRWLDYELVEKIPRE